MNLFLGMAVVSTGPLPGGLVRIVGREGYAELASGVFCLAMASVVAWLTLGIGKGLPHHKMFSVMIFLYATCGAAQVAAVLAHSQDWPSRLLSGMQIFVAATLLLLAILMFVSIPALLTVLRASDEVRIRRGQAKFQALVQAAPMAVVGTDCEGRVTSWNPSAERIFGWKQEEVLGTLAATVPEDRQEA